jgi:hypothetical protein
MAETLQNPDWFDAVWAKHEKELPIWLRGQKKLARQLIGAFVESMGAYAKTPTSMQQVIAFAKVASMVKGMSGLINAPDPSPEEVVTAVERLVRKVKP